MAPPRQQDTPASATSSHTKSQQPSSKTSKSSRSKKTKKRAEPISTLAPRQPDEIEEAETATIPSTQAPPIPAPSKQKPKRVESSDDDEDSDDAESVYLSGDDDEEEDSYDDESSSDESTDSGDSVEELPPRQLARRSTTGRDVKNTPGSPFTITQTRSETTRWITTQNNGGMTRGTRSLNEQTTMHGQNLNGQRPTTNRNSVSFNMSINVDMSFNGLVTGRNLGFSGGSLSYAWNRRNTQGG